MDKQKRSFLVIGVFFITHSSDFNRNDLYRQNRIKKKNRFNHVLK